MGPGVKTGINIKYENPKEVGPYRIAHAVAALKEVQGASRCHRFRYRHHFRRHFIQRRVSRRHHLPGDQTSLEALFEKGGQATWDRTQTPRAIGKTSAESMQSGMVYRFAGNGGQW